MTITVSEINIYPLKSAAPIKLGQSGVSKRGLENDRHWMLTDGSGKCLTAREFPSMLNIKSELFKNGILFKAGDENSIKIALPDQANPKATIEIWSNNCQATLISTEADQWFSDYLGTDCKLVYMRSEDDRAVLSNAGGHEGDVVSFADENPLLLITEASLAELNSRLEHPVTMLNFRPNIVVAGSAAFAEDDWEKIQIADSTYRVAQACKRCNLTTIDPVKAQFRDDGEPLKTAAKFRYDRDRSGILFGIHLIPESTFSRVEIGNRLTVIE